jgi:hypothetical protein
MESVRRKTEPHQNLQWGGYRVKPGGKRQTSREFIGYPNGPISLVQY